MKANKAPEKIWINSPQDLPCSSVDSNSIEYTRTDVFIEKAEKYLTEKFIKDISILSMGRVNINFAPAISNFLKYMKGE